MLNVTSTSPKVNFRVSEYSVPNCADFDVGIHIASVEEVNNRLKNSLFGYFIGKRLAFMVVELYICNAWSKYGVQKVSMNAKGFFHFKSQSHNQKTLV